MLVKYKCIHLNQSAIVRESEGHQKDGMHSLAAFTRCMASEWKYSAFEMVE